MKFQNKLDRAFVGKLARFVDANLENCAQERIERLQKGLSDLGKAITNLDRDAAEMIDDAVTICLDKKKKEKK